MEITKTQENFLLYCERLGWGRIELQSESGEKLKITIRNGEPVFLTIIEKDVKLDEV
mgnify:CR=1 FL=1